MSTVSFGRALADERRRHRLSQRALGMAIGVSQGAVTQWERGTIRPSVEHAFAAERALRLPPGTLARLLGFGPPPNAPLPTPRRPTVVEAILADDGLDDEQRQLLIGMYHQLHAHQRRR